MKNDKENVIVEKSFQFALDIITYCELLEKNMKFVISKQLLRSGTSIGANTREAQNAESKIDYIHKIKIAAKEAEEAQYWLLLCKHSHSYPSNDKLLENVTELLRILAKIIVTSKSN